MAEQVASELPRSTDKRGGYSGSKPASQMRPPARIPSAVTKPARVRRPKAG
jgi:hypothetical protein